jgi:hypothetical protein
MEVEDEAAATAKASVDAGYAARPISCERLLRDEIFQAQMRNVPCHVILTSISCLVRHQA